MSGVVPIVVSSALPRGYIKLFPCLTQLSTKFILLINVKMPTIVGILTFISMINTTSERLKARNLKLKFCAQLSMKKGAMCDGFLCALSLEPAGRLSPTFGKF